MSDFTNTDNLETLLLLAMDSEKYKMQRFLQRDSRKLGLEKEIVSVGDLLKIPDKKPFEAYTFDAMDDGRLYTSGIDLLSSHPLDIIEDGIETILFYENQLKWVRLEIIKRPKGFICIGKAEEWVAIHFRRINTQGAQEYVKEAFPVDKKGNVLPVKIEGWNLSEKGIRYEYEEQMSISCSIVDDAKRKGALLAKASVESSIVFPIAHGAHKEFFAMRDGPRETPSGKKNPIIHFCQKHIRKTDGKETEVKGHWRGREKITIDGMSIEISTEGF